MRRNDGIALFAPHNTGKTYLTVRLIESGWEFISEDIAILINLFSIGRQKSTVVDLLAPNECAAAAPVGHIVFLLDVGNPRVRGARKPRRPMVFCG